MVPELCSMSGLSDEAKKDFRVMKVSEYRDVSRMQLFDAVIREN